MSLNVFMMISQNGMGGLQTFGRLEGLGLGASGIGFRDYGFIRVQDLGSSV